MTSALRIVSNVSLPRTNTIVSAVSARVLLDPDCFDFGAAAFATNVPSLRGFGGWGALVPHGLRRGLLTAGPPALSDKGNLHVAAANAESCGWGPTSEPWRMRVAPQGPIEMVEPTAAQPWLTSSPTGARP